MGDSHKGTKVGENARTAPARTAGEGIGQLGSPACVGWAEVLRSPRGGPALAGLWRNARRRETDGSNAGVRVCLLSRGQVFVGNLPPEAEARDLRDFFRDFGTINDAWVARKPPGFGFVWFDDERDAVSPDCFPASSQCPSPVRRGGETTRRALSRASMLRAANRRAPSLLPRPCGRQGPASVASMKARRRERHTASGISLCVHVPPGACKPPEASISSRAAASAQARVAARAAETANSSASRRLPPLLRVCVFRVRAYNLERVLF